MNAARVCIRPSSTLSTTSILGKSGCGGGGIVHVRRRQRRRQRQQQQVRCLHHHNIHDLGGRRHCRFRWTYHHPNQNMSWDNPTSFDAQRWMSQQSSSTSSSSPTGDTTTTNTISKTSERIIQTMADRYSELMQFMDESPSEAYRYGKELSTLENVVQLKQRLDNLQQELESVHELLQQAHEEDEHDDDELQQECQKDIERLTKSIVRTTKRLLHAILPRDEDDYDSDAIIEIRAGTGGDEATLFSSELADTYQRIATSFQFGIDVMSESRTDMGGIKETVFAVTQRSGSGGSGDYHMYDNLSDDDDDDDDGDENNSVDQILKMTAGMGPYGLFKYESGGHRVQRVPINDTRMQTSVCSVAVLPMIQDDPSSSTQQQLLPMSELTIETMRASGAGGQHVNTTDSAVRVTHIPTGITASIQDQRSQHKNKEKALKLVAARVRNAQREEQERQLGEQRSSLLGGGDRSERIRTYNFPQDRVTDHRCKHSSHGISKLFNGSKEDGLVSTFWPYLQRMVQEEQMAAMEQQGRDE